MIRISPDMKIVADKLHGLATADLSPIMRSIADAMAPIIEARIREEAPRRTEAGAGTIRANVAMGGAARSSRVEVTGASYFQYVIQGTEAHVIEPRNVNGVMVFIARDGNLVFSRHVEHPGQRSNPFVRRAWDHLRGEIYPQVRKTGARAYLELARTWFR